MVQSLFFAVLRRCVCAAYFAVFLTTALSMVPTVVTATPFTRTVPGTNITLPNGYPEAGGVAFVLVGANGNIYYQFSNPTGAFRGFNFNGQPTRFRGNPFTINDPLQLNCGFSDCSTYFGGAIANLYIRFTALDGDTQPGGFDENDISLIINGFNVGSWSGLVTENTNTAGTQSLGFGTGFGNNTFDTGWFSSTNAALLNNILTTGQTTTQVLDDDPNDNRWDFRRGGTISNADNVTVAPGLTIEKVARSAGGSNAPVKTTYDAGEQIFYTFELTNIGSVRIDNLAIDDPQLSSTSCPVTSLNDVNPGETPNSTICTGVYAVTQADIDAGTITNTATATGTPTFGVLGAVSDSVTLTGPAPNPVLTLTKDTTLATFGAAGTSVPYTFEVTNTGNVTVTNLTVTDPKVSTISCPVTELAPTEGTTCTGSYTVTQADVDAFAVNGTPLSNTATATGDAARGTDPSVSDTRNLNGQVAAPALVVTKTTTSADFSSVGEVIPFQIQVSNTGNVTWPGPPTITDVLTGGATCPAGAVAPGSTVTCTASYPITQLDLDRGDLTNEASASITVGGLTATGTDDVTINADVALALTLQKRLAAASPSSFSAQNVALSYEYVVRNTGNQTLDPVQVEDDKVAVTCPVTSLAPNTQTVCTSAAYQTTLVDLNAGGVTNIAVAVGNAGAADEVRSAQQSLTVPAVQSPGLSLVKSGPSLTAAQFVLNAPVQFDFAVTVSGNTTITQQIVVQDDKLTANVNCGTPPYDPGTVVTCSGIYNLQQADVDAGTLVNTATATDGTVTSPPSSVTISPNFSPAISLVKTAQVASVNATGPVTYDFAVTNDSNFAINVADITITDAKIPSITCPASPASLTQGQSTTCTGVYNVIQSDLDNGEIINNATASFPFTNGGTTVTIQSANAQSTLPVVETVDLFFEKQGPAQFTTVGNPITYTFFARNDGNTTLTSVVVSDPLIPSLSCTLGPIAPGASTSCTGQYSPTQADVDAEQILNTASAIAATQGGGSQTRTSSATTPINVANATKQLSVAKTPNRLSFTAVGDTITYFFEVTNTGTQTLANIVVNDPILGTTCTIASLVPGATDGSCSAMKMITQADLDAGSGAASSFTNTVSVTADGSVGPVTDSATVNGPNRTASLDLSKTVPGDFSGPNETVTFTLTVENTGTTTLDNVVITDTFFTPTLTCPTATLSPGQTFSCSGSYVTTQPDVNAGFIENSASVTADTQGGLGGTVNDSAVLRVDGPAANPVIELEKTASAASYGLGDTLTYSFEVFNRGNVTLAPVVVSDPGLGLTCTIPQILPGASDASTCSAPRSFAQSDVNAGFYENTATATGTIPGGGTVDDSDTLTVFGPAQTVELSVVKTVQSGSPFAAVGDTVSYNYAVRNDGNITITNAISVSDDKTSVTCPALPSGGLLPNAVLNCTASYAVVQADLDAGSVTNAASASVSQPVVPRNPGDPSVIDETSPTVTATATATQNGALTLDKRVASTSVATYSAVNDTVTFEYIVTNSGNVTIDGPIEVTDDKIPGTLQCQAGNLAPGASVTCSQDWTADQTALNDGSVTNIGTAQGTFNSAVVTATDSETVTAIQNAELDLLKETITPFPAGLSAGLVLNYRYTVSNPGNVTIGQPITITDNLANTASCTRTTDLLPGDSYTCDISYTITANDVTLGSVTNTAFAEGDFDGTTVMSPTRAQIFPVTAQPALTLVKTADKTALTTADLGTNITYTFQITNSGNVDFANDIDVTDDQLGTFLCIDLDQSTTELFQIGQSRSCPQTAVVTQAMLDDGEITNIAVAQVDFSGTMVESPSDTVTIPATIDPELTIQKVATLPATVTAADLGTDISYALSVENTGEQTIETVVITDPLFPGLSCTVASLAPTATLTCPPQIYTITQADLDDPARLFSNTASARGNAPDGSNVASSITVDTPLVGAGPALAVSKALLNPPPPTEPDYTVAGEVLTFAVTVTNSGNVTLSSVNVTDDLDPTTGTCTVGPLAPGASDSSCQFTYTVTQDDVDNGSFVNTATGVAQPVTQAGPIPGVNGPLTLNGPVAEPSYGLLKASNVTSFDAPGVTITYSYTVSNNGNVTLTTQPTLTDDKLGTITCPLPTGGLVPGAFVICQETYVTQQSDVDAGGITNVGTVSSPETPLDATSTVTVPSSQTGGLDLVKTADTAGPVGPNDTINYTFAVENTGNITLSSVQVVDAQNYLNAGGFPLTLSSGVLVDNAPLGDSPQGGAAAGNWGTLAPGDVVRFTGSYTVSQNDFDTLDNFDNRAEATASNVGSTVNFSDTEIVTMAPATLTPALDVTKLVTNSTGQTAGSTITFEISVDNTGNASVASVSVADTLTRNDGTPLTLTSGPTLNRGDGGVSGRLEVDETWVYVATYQLTQDDIDAGGVRNSATVSGTDLKGGAVSDVSDDDPAPGGSDPTAFAITGAPGLEATKTASVPSVGVGDTATFTITVENIGNVTLTSVGVADTLTRLDGTPLSLSAGPGFVSASAGSGQGSLVPGEIATYTAQYVLTQDDIDAGGVENSATASGTPPVGAPISDVSDDGDDGDGNDRDDPTQVLINAAPALELVKRLQAGSGPSFDTVGDTLIYEFEVTNTGNVTITDPVTIADPLITNAGGTISCAAPPIAPGASVVCTGSYSVTQADLNNGSVDNSATASAPGTQSPLATLSTPAVQSPALSMVKTADPITSTQFLTGAVATYTYTVTNTGNTTVTTPITITDDKIPAGDISCPPFPSAGVAPTETYSCTGTYTVTMADVFNGSVTNLATATSGTTSSPQTSETVPDSGAPALTVTKTAAPQQYAATTDVITYTFRVTNSGTRAFASTITVDDDRIGALVCFTPSGADPELAPGEFVDCFDTDSPTQADLDAGTLTNTATATGTVDGGTVPVTSAPVSETITATITRDLGLTKTVSTLPITAVNQVLTYELTATNNSNVTLSNVVVTDPLLPALSCSIASLAPGAQLVCTEPYTVTQADIDDPDGLLTNVASVTSTDPGGGPVGNTVTVNTPLPTQNAGVQITKVATPDPLGPAGSTVTYRFSVQNLGNVTLSDATVTDVLDAGYSCVIPSLPPATTDTGCTLDITVTQDMVDAGSLENTASVSATTPAGGTVTDDVTVTTTGPAQAPSLEATKTAVVPAPVPGQKVVYTLTVRNTGNVTLTDIDITDTMTRKDGQALALDAPFAFQMGDTDGDGALDVGETWAYTAEKTILQSDINFTGFSNSVRVDAVDPNSGAVFDVSDDGDDGDGNTVDDATEVDFQPLPSLEVTKALIAQAGSMPGDLVTFEITAVNTGNVDLENVLITDTLTRLDGTVLTPTSGPTRTSTVPQDNGDSTFEVTEVLRWQVTYQLVQEDIDAGGIENTATVSATSISDGTPVSDVSDDGDDSDGNTTNDRTQVLISPAPVLDVIKTVTSAGTQAGEQVVFTITADNTGNVTLSDLSLADDLSRLGGGTLIPDAITFQGPGAISDPLVPGGSVSWRVTYTLLQADIDAGGIQNSATVTANTPLAGSVSDRSDDDGTGADDPTVAAIAANPSFDVAKSAGSVRVILTTIYEVTFTIDVTNTGNVTQSDIRVEDDLTAFIGSGVLRNADYPPSISQSGFAGTPGTNGGYDGLVDTQLLTGNPELAPGDTGQVILTVTYQDFGNQASGNNTARATSTQLPTPATGGSTTAVTDDDGDGVPDFLEGCGPGDDRDGDGVCDREDYDPTGYFYCEDTGAILSGGSISVTGPSGTQSGVGTSNNITIVQDGSRGFYQFFATAPGTYRLNINYPSNGEPSTTRTSRGSLDLTTLLPSNPAVIGSTEFGNSGQLTNFTAGANPFFTTFVIDVGDPYVFGNNIPLRNCAPGDTIFATKTADRDSAVFGETINFTLGFTNSGPTNIAALEVIDRLPSGLIYTPGSGVVDGKAVEPDMDGLRLSWDNVALPPGKTVQVSFAARVIANGTYGELVNRTWIQDRNGRILSNIATAKVRIEPEHVFDCSDIIGKVFDDQNRNGYQDQGEPGLPGVRVVTIRGERITTDEYGRYHIPCAELPPNIGTNFTLKLDPRTLPTGYRVTTENPRVMRVTAGKIAKLNFGAALSKVVDIDLTATAFESGTPPNAALGTALDGLIDQIATVPYVVRLSYLHDGSAPDLARARVKLVEKMIRERWRGKGRYKLIIERTVKQVE